MNRLVLLSTNMARGGAETQVAHLAIELKRRGWAVDVVSLLAPTAFTDELAGAGVPLHAPGLARIPALLRRLRPRLLHCHMFHANLLGRVLRLVLPVPAVISTLHSAAESRRRTGSIRQRDLLYRATDRLADATVAVSAAVAERHRQAHAVRAPLVIPNGVDTERFRPDPAVRARVREQLRLGDEFVWLAAGRLMWKKNYPALLNAFHSLESGTLLIAGVGPDEPALRAMAGPNVRFLGQRSDMPELMNAADAYVLTSVVEGLPLALLEAGAVGLPCVATDAGGVRETGIGIVGAPDQLATAMLSLMRMAAEARGAMGQAARKTVIARYSLTTVASEWEALYRNLMPWS